jgi:hypothetical protein
MFGRENILHKVSIYHRVDFKELLEMPSKTFKGSSSLSSIAFSASRRAIGGCTPFWPELQFVSVVCFTRLRHLSGSCGNTSSVAIESDFSGDDRRDLVQLVIIH